MLSGINIWDIPGCERLGVPEWNVSDGPVGVRGRVGVESLLVPGPTALAATWDPELVAEVGEALGTECVDRNVDMLLAPTTNLHRAPRNGRHFESYSEEPLLSSQMAVGFVRGVQSTGVGACIKHYVANDQEHERMSINVEVDERTLREIYLPPFEAAVKEAGVRGVMGAYNYVNGEHACAHRELLVDVLKSEWGFDGVVVSDWDAIKDTAGPANGGLDVEMPGPGRLWGDDQLLAAVEAGEVDEASIDDKVARVLAFLEWRGRLQGSTNHAETENERPEHRALALRAATESTVLAKNAGELLPLADDCTVAVIGALAERTSAQGGGSARLPAYRRPSLLVSLRTRLGERMAGFASGVNIRRLPPRIERSWLHGEAPVKAELFANMDLSGTPIESVETDEVWQRWREHPALKEDPRKSVRQTAQVRVPEADDYVFVGMSVGDVTLRVDGEIVAVSSPSDIVIGLAFSTARATISLDAHRTYEFCIEASHDGGEFDFASAAVDLRLAPAGPSTEELADEAAELAMTADVAVVVVGTTSEWEREGEDRQDLDLPAEQSLLVKKVAAANPNTVVVLNSGSPINMPWFDDVAAVLVGWYPGQEGGDALTAVLVGEADPGGRMPTTWAAREEDTPSFGNYPGAEGVVTYGEGVFVGYRHYDRAGIDPLIPFGHGSSYATSEWGDATTTCDGDRWTVEVPVLNTSHREGTEVVQVYVGPAVQDDSRPDKILAGFAKVHLGPGVKSAASINLDPRFFQTWDAVTHRWERRAGDYLLTVAASATDPRSTSIITVV